MRCSEAQWRSTMFSRMPDPVIVPRAEHPISRRNIDADALKVLYRLHQFNYAGYLVGGSVRDLLLGRQPKDFDIGTDAHPYQIKKLFRNCWIIGRRFRLAHVRFGNKTIEVATFRRGVPPGTENEPAEPAADTHAPDLAIRHDNTFGTPEEDAFRRDFTINALFYDIATFSIIDYVGGLDDLREGLIRSIGDPNERFQEDPVRMFRAVSFAARLGFRLDTLVVDAIAAHRRLIASASPARLVEEYYKVLRSGAAEQTFRQLAALGLLEPITPELHGRHEEDALWMALGELDRYRRKFESVPEGLTNAILLGTLLIPLGLMPSRRPTQHDEPLEPVDRTSRRRRPPKEPPLRIGLLPAARRDTERLRQILLVQRRLMDLESSPRAKRALMHKGPFEEAMVWLEIHGRAPEALEHWRGFIEASGPLTAREADEVEGAEPVPPAPGRRRRRRRGRRRGGRGLNRKIE
jgi:poly(A) polymerase